MINSITAVQNQENWSAHSSLLLGSSGSWSTCAWQFRLPWCPNPV